MSEPERGKEETRDRSPGNDGLFRKVLTASLLLNLAAGTILSILELPERIASQADALPRTALVSYGDASELPEAVMDPEADPLLSDQPASTTAGELDATEVERVSARTSEGEGGEESTGSGSSEAASAEQAFLSVFGDPSAEGSGGGGVLDEAGVRADNGAGSSAPRASRPRSGIGDGEGSGRAGRQPLSGGSSGVEGRLGPGEGDGGGIERTGRVTISNPEPSSEEEEASGTSAEVFERIGNRVRRHEAQIRFCYQEEGLKENPELAGTVRVEFDVSGGEVTSAAVRSGLSGRGSEATESCILEAVRGWRFVDVDESVTVPFTFVLSR